MRHLIIFRNLTIANDLLPAIAYDDCSGLEDSDIEQLNDFLTDLESEITAFCDTLTPDKFFYSLSPDEVREDDFRWCDVTKLQALCSPITVRITTHGGATPDANLYDYISFAS